MSNLLLTIENPKRDIYWRKLVPNDFEEVKNIILKHSVKWEPLCATVGLTVDNGALDFVDDTWESVVEGQSICAYDTTSSNNKIVAIWMVSGPYSPNNKASNWGNGKKKPEKLEQVYRITECMSFGPDKIVESHAGDHKFVKGFLVTVVEEYLKLGLGTALTRKSWELAKEAGCKYYFSELTSAYSAKIFENAGGKVLKEILYSKYTDSVSGEKIMANCEPPHVCAKTIAVTL